MRITLGIVLGTLLAAPSLASAQQGVSSAGHARTRRMAELGRLPSAAEVVVEDIINYHQHAVPLPRGGEAVALDLRWGNAQAGRGDRATLQVGLATQRVHDATRLKPCNLALVIDRSGSMADEDKLVRVRQALRSFVRRLRPDDRVALVAYDSGAQVLLPSRPVGSGRELLEVIDQLQAEGATNLHAGLMLGYEQVAEHLLSNGTNRVILLTDGIANEGVTEPAAIVESVKARGGERIDLTTIGLGQDFQHGLLSQLAESGRGLFHFVADTKDIEKVFVDEVQSLIAPAAREVSLCLEWDSPLQLQQVYAAHRRVGEHRLVVDLPDLNHGATMAVMVEFRVPEWCERGSLDVRAVLRHRAEGEERPRSLDQRAELQAVRSHPDPLVDPEVRKNASIALMARALHDMAVLAEKERWGEAEKLVVRALRLMAMRYPQTEDEDLLTTRRMLEQSRKALGQRLDCLRDSGL